MTRTARPVDMVFTKTFAIRICVNESVLMLYEFANKDVFHGIFIGGGGGRN